MNALIRLQEVKKSYRLGAEVLEVLHGIDLTVQSGEYVTIMGPSGSGKSTLMHILGCLDLPSAGEYWFEDQPLSRLGEAALTPIRRQKIGFVFQSFNLLPTLTAIENVALPLLYQRVDGRLRLERARQALERVGLGHRMQYRPNQLSGGQQQRVAIARALVTDPPLILADEPTGNLDTPTGQDVLELLQSLHREGHTIVLITHDVKVAGWGQRVVEIQDGRIIGDRQVSA
ncbi:ABC transporter related protein [Sulfobacillus acidophilus TPY]|uniref:Phosphonate-transporting ATPase n=1 Tax=Sulfobacillus acidophilus (strain ATCC 700253 / DSM 10332 / NAL) TaxID=679936 RepID=G8U1B5_SULAD|nr:ABC transporter related protein [Sulfobacillus acidophilus TPY]AEW05435.1 Phosphonate-transporting ATPase [Sulfobacillus acidophilus DSM 10332]